MTQRNNLTTQPIHPASLGKRMLQGAGIALILIGNRKKYRNEMLSCIPINPINPINPGSDYTSLCYGLVPFWD